MAGALVTVGLVAATAVTGPAAYAADAPIGQRTASQVTADALPTVQINGVVWDQAVAGNTVYAGGQFTAARPAGSAAGQNETARGNLLAYDITTGNLVTSFAPALNGVVNVVALSPDKSRVYVGGSFTTANGAARTRIAAYSTATGQLVSSFAPSLDAQVKGITVTNTAVYVGGIFSRANGVARSRLAAFSPSNGALLGWAPTADSTVNALQVTPNGSKVIAAGAFGTVNGAVARGLAALDAGSGALLPFAVNTVVQNYGTTAANVSLKADGSTIYGTGYWFGGTGNFEGVWAADAQTGAVKWLADCHGDTYDSQPMNGAVYSVSHHHHCENIASFPEQSPRQHVRGNAFTAQATGTVRPNNQGGYGNFAGYGSPSQINWFPDMQAGSFTGQTQAGWSVEGNADYLAIGGEFPRVNGVLQQGLVRFAVAAKAPKKVGHQISAANSAPTARALSGDAVRVSWPTNWDRDDKQLTYEVRRSGVATPVQTVTAESLWWQRRTLTFVDSGLSPNTTYSYQIREYDQDGNGSWSNSVSVATGSGAVAESAYNRQVQTDGATDYWRLRESAGSATATDWAGSNDLALGTGVTLETPGAIVGSTDTAATFAGTTAGLAATTTAAPAPSTFSVEAWVKTTSTAGGKIVGYGNQSTGTSNSYDRHVYVDADGRVTFGVYTGAVRTLRSPAAVNDGEWHHLVGTQSAAGMALFVDGDRVGLDPSVTAPSAYSGYWRLGGDNLGGWPNVGSSTYLAGVIDDVAVYPGALTAAQVADHFSDSGRTDPSNTAPVARIADDCTGLTCSFDGLGSTDADGSVVGYAWDFGDGSSSTAATPNHAYAESGTYTVALTVTDDDGATDRTTVPVTVTAPANVAPTADFAASVSGLTAAFDGRGSRDGDGTIASYAWTYGDGSSASGASPSRTYAGTGAYTVKLTVTDDDGATDSVTKRVVVGGPPVVADSFGRTSAGSWGPAETGGTWSVNTPTTRFSTDGEGGAMALEAPRAGATATLGSVSTTNANGVVDLSVDKVGTGSGTYSTFILRKQGTSDYRVSLIFGANGALSLSAARVASGTETAIRTVNVSGLTYGAGDVLRLRFGLSGTNPTTITAKVWTSGRAEPATPQLTTTDSTAGLQSAGAFAIKGYLGGSATNAPVVVRYDNLLVTSS